MFRKITVTILLCLSFPVFAQAEVNVTIQHPLLQKTKNQLVAIVQQKIANPKFQASDLALFRAKEDEAIIALAKIDAAVKNRDRAAAAREIQNFQNTYKNLLSLINERAAQPTVSTITVDTTPSTTKGTPADILYYSDSFEGGGTSNGNPFSQSYFSAARCDLAFNTLVQANAGGKGVIVKVNDRPNCKRYPNIIDLTTSAFNTLAPVSRGKIAGSVVPLGSVNKSYTKQYLATDSFASLGITLDTKIPNTYLLNETLHITGTENNGKDDTVLFLRTPSGKDVSLSRKKDEQNRIDYSYPLEETGIYKMVIASGLSFETSTFIDITVFDASVFAAKSYNKPAKNGQIDTLKIERVETSDLTAFNTITFPTRDLYTLTIEQDGKKRSFIGIGEITLRVDAFKDFDTSRNVNATVTVQQSSTNFSHDTYTEPAVVFSKSVFLGTGHKKERKENIDLSLEGSNLVIRGTITKGSNVDPEVLLILPSGNVAKFAFDADMIDRDGYLKRGVLFGKTIPLHDAGIYQVELNYSNGFAAYNGPITFGDYLPLLGNAYDVMDKGVEKVNASSVPVSSLAYINTIRTNAGLTAISLDDTLNNLAAIKARDMAANNYVGHTDSKGGRIIETAARNGITIAGSVGENVAGGNVNYQVLLIGLSESAGHRENMLGDWAKVGIGYVEKDGQTYYVQVF